MGKKNKKKNKLSYLDESDFDAPMTYDGDDYQDYGGGNSKKKNKRGNSSRYDDIYGGDDYGDYGGYADYENDEYDNESEYDESGEYAEDDEGAEDVDYEDYEDEELEEEEESDEEEERYDPDKDPYKDWGKPNSERTPSVAASSSNADSKANAGLVNSNVFQETPASSASPAATPSWGLKPKQVVATPAPPATNASSSVAAPAPKPVVATPASSTSGTATAKTPASVASSAASSNASTAQETKQASSVAKEEETRDEKKSAERRDKVDEEAEKKADDEFNDETQSCCEDDEDWEAGPSLAERLKPVFALFAAPFRVFKKREKTEDELFAEELEREEKEKKAAEYAELKRLAEETGEEVDFSGYEDLVEAENKKSVLRFLSPILYLKLLGSLALAPLLLFKRKKKDDAEDWDDANASEEADAKSKNAVEESEESVEEETDEETDEFEGRNWMRVAIKTIGVASVATFILLIGYVALLFFSGKHVGKTTEPPVALAEAEGTASDAKDAKTSKNQKKESGGFWARVGDWFGGDSKEKKGNPKQQKQTAKKDDAKTGADVKTNVASESKTETPSTPLLASNDPLLNQDEDGAGLAGTDEAVSAAADPDALITGESAAASAGTEFGAA
ncbi:MAG: hypothetical protein IJE97_06260, partial [Thermoguttaceae bacterium]|nr:hypothetical protein [Thermoguttaceae bacterium]